MAIAADLLSPSASYLALYIIYLHVLDTNTRSSTHWKLNAVSGKVEALAAGGGGSGDGRGVSHFGWDPEDDHVMTMLTNRIPMENGEWKLEAEPSCSENCQRSAKTGDDNDTKRLQMRCPL